MAAMNARPTLAPAAMAAMILAGCATDSGSYKKYSEPYVLFEAEHHLGVSGVVPAIVVSVDGVKYRDDTKDPIKPGVHVVEVSVAGAPDTQILTKLTVDAKPCTRYYLGVKRSAQPNAEWTPLVTNSESIGECRKPSSY